jgi:Mg2+ and Co2+ transporter CorA
MKYHPVIENKPMIALKSHLLRPDAAERETWTTQDPISQLYQNYGRSLRPDIKAADPFYALGEVFQLSANSQQQFLNMIDAKLRIYSAKGPKHDHDILSHLKYTQQILYSRISDIKRVLMSIENTLRPAWAKSNSDSGREKAKIAYNTIQRDFKHLLDHAVSLYDRTREAISVLQSSISITESQFASLQADKAGKLTFLASAFVPISVATGIFGMNFKELSGDDMSIYWFFVVVAILTTFTAVLFYFKGFWRRFRAQMTA